MAVKWKPVYPNATPLVYTVGAKLNLLNPHVCKHRAIIGCLFNETMFEKLKKGVGYTSGN